ncbi:MAG: hypothetical protein AAGA62_12600, partial [Bacteroidota bacterium]
VACLLLGFYACTPKATAPISEAPSQPVVTPKPEPQGDLSPCAKFTDAPNPDDAETNYVIYRQLMKAKEMDEAFKTWRKVYAVSPAADGKRATVFTDGIAFYNRLIQENPSKKEMYGDTIISLYQEARRCYPGDGYMSAIQAFDSYYTYPGSATDEEIYALFKESVEIDGPEKLQYFVINPMSSLVVKMHREGKIDAAEAKKIVEALNTRLELGLKECQGAQCEAWNTIKGYAPDALRYFETVKGFYDCDYYINQYYPDFEENPKDCDVIRTAFSRLRYGDCPEDSPQLTAIQAAYEENCIEPNEPSKVAIGFECLKNGDYDCAVENLTAAAQEADTDEKKGRYYLYVAKIFFAHKRNFSQARKFARRAAQANPSSGEPYLLIGTLYASSGPLCGPGTGFDSQIVTWPAIDKWLQAKRVQPDLASQANKLINRYTQYMPSKADIFQRGIKEGDSFTVGCWIQETTRVRTP